jgi:hypothetical protein
MGRVKDMATDFGKLTDEQMKVWSNDMMRMVKDVKDEAAWDAMKGKQLKDIVIESTIKEQDFDVLRDFLVDMCSATLPEHPPSQKDWDKLRDRTKAAAVEHSLLNRDEKKAAKKPGAGVSIGAVSQMTQAEFDNLLSTRS